MIMLVWACLILFLCEPIAFSGSCELPLGQLEG